MTSKRRALAALILPLLVFAGACGGDDPDHATGADDPARSTTTLASAGSTASSDDAATTTVATSSVAAWCDAVTPELFAAIYGPEAAMAEPSGNRTKCATGLLGASQGENIEFLDMADYLETYDQVKTRVSGTANPMCGRTPLDDVSDLGVAAFYDGRCLESAGQATLFVDDGTTVVQITVRTSSKFTPTPDVVKSTMVDLGTQVVSLR